MKVSAAVLREPTTVRPFSESKPLRIETVDLDPPGPGEVLVRIMAAGLCHSDLSGITGARKRKVPTVVGHESAGIVEAVGDAVVNVRQGDHVVSTFVASCGLCSFCIAGRPNLCQRSWDARETGALRTGGRRIRLDGEPLHHYSGVSCFAEFAVVASESLVPISKSVPFADAALFGCAVLTGVGAAINTARVSAGSSVAVVGLGGVGLSAVMGASISGARQIIAIDTSPAKLQLAMELGATHACSATEADLVDEVKHLSSGGVDFALEMAGAPAAAASALAITARGGAMVTAGLPPAEASLAVPLASLVAQELEVRGSYMGGALPARDIPRLVDLYEQGRLPVERLRSKVIPLHQINHGFDRLDQGLAVRDVVSFAHDDSATSPLS